MAGLTPLVTIQIQTNNYLGPPYTKCLIEKGYSITICHYQTVHRQIARICGCVLDYIPFIRDVVQNSTIKACSFYEHSTCASFVISEFDPQLTDCVPACLDSVYRQVKIQVQTGFIILTLTSYFDIFSTLSHVRALRHCWRRIQCIRI